MGPKGVLFCGKCNLELPKNGDYAYCNMCNSGLHFEKCSGIKGSTWKGKSLTSQGEWICPSCRSRRKASNTDPEEVSEEPSAEDDLEVSSLGVSKSILEKVNCLLTMKNDLTSIEQSMKFLADKYDKILEEVAALRDENKHLRKELDVVKRVQHANQSLIDAQSMEIADLDQYGRRFNLEIHGVKLEGNASQENIEEPLKKIAEKIKVNFNKDRIHQAHRLQQRSDGKPATILVQFFSKEDRDMWMKAGRQEKIPNIYFNENLCYYYRQLLRDTKLRARAYNCAYVWWQGGKILVRRREGDRNVIVIKSNKDLNKIGE